MNIYLEPYLQKRKLVVFGHVPIVDALVRMGKMLNFSVSVVDKYASKERFPEADAVFSSVEEFRASAKQEFLDQTYVIVATMGECDQEYMQRITELEIPYIGVVAGKKWASELLAYLRGNDIPEERLARIRAPARIYIRAVTAEEIALSLMAEIIELARTKSNDPRELKVRRTDLAYKEEKLESPIQVKDNSKEGSDSRIFVDSICDIIVEASSEYHTTLDVGRIVYFCCQRCKESFDRDPQNHALEQEN